MNKQYPPQLLIALIGLVGFLVVVSTFGFKDRLLSTLYPKPPSHAASDFPKGVNWFLGSWYDPVTNYNLEGIKVDLDRMKAGDITWVRYILYYNETSCNQIHGKVITELKARGMNPLLKIYIQDYKTTTASDTDIARFKTWLNTMVNCFKADTKYWEIWNEPNYSNFWNINHTLPASDQAYKDSVGYYVKYLQAAHEVIKGIDPNLMIVHGGLYQGGDADTKFVAELINQGAYQYFDIMGFHPYSDTGKTGILNELNGLKAAMSTNPQMAAKPIWITEVGFSPTSYPGHVNGDENTKAQVMAESWQAMRDWGITYPIMWYYWDYGGDGYRDYNLVQTDRTAAPYPVTYMPAYYTHRDLWTTTPTPSASPITTGSVTVDPVSDSYVDNSTTTTSGTNYGSLNYLIFDGSPNRTAYFKFNMPDLTGKTLTSVKLKIKTNADINAPSGGPLNVNLVSDNNWGETTINFNNKPALSTLLGSSLPSCTDASNKVCEIDLTSLSSIPKTTGDFSVAVSTNNADGGFLHSREATNLADRPQLLISYEIPTASPTPTPTLSTPGDIEPPQGDGDVDIFDYNQLVSDFNKTGSGLAGDIDPQPSGDGDVDIFDYNILVTNFGR